jgi:RecA-family ATPase
VPGWYKRGGFTLVSGPPKRSGKSLLVERHSILIASGLSDQITKFVPAGTFRVLYVGEEGPRADAKMRFGAHLNGLGIAPEVVSETLYVSHLAGLKLMTPEHGDTLTVWVSEIKIDLLVLDPWSEVGPPDENSAEEVKRCMAVVKDIQRLGCAVTLVLHLKKPSDKPVDIDDELRGSGMIAGSYDTHIALRPVSTWKAPGDPVKVIVRHKAAMPWEGKLAWTPTTEKRLVGDTEVDYTIKLEMKWVP